MLKRQEISLFFFLILLVPIAHAQKDTTKAKKYNVWIGGDIDIEESGMTYLQPGYTIVGGGTLNLAVQNKKKTGIELDLSYNQKEINSFSSVIIGKYALLAICARHDTKIFYYGLGPACDFKIAQNIWNMQTNPSTELTPFNMSLIGFVGLKKSINKYLELYAQGELIQDLIWSSWSPWSPNGNPNSDTGISINLYGFRNLCIAFGLEYLIQ